MTVKADFVDNNTPPDEVNAAWLNEVAGKANTTYVTPGGVLGTPASGTLTNCSGLPVAGITASTSTALGVGSIELGHASDTSLTRTSPGVVAVEGTALLKSGGALGTPSGGTLTNCGSLPVSGITASTSTALGVGSIELGHASDTTISRVSGGVVAVEGVNVVLSTALADIPHYLIWSGSAWPDRPADTRPAIFVGGSVASDEPDDADLRSGDVWIPATA